MLALAVALDGMGGKFARAINVCDHEGTVVPNGNVAPGDVVAATSSKYIYPKYEPEILDAVFVRQKKILNDKNLSDEEKEKKAPFFILLDDVISDQRLRYDANLMELFVAGRHYKLFVLMAG